MRDPYWRRATAVRVVDGDTLILTIDVGFHLTATLSCRLLGINTPEPRNRDPEKRRLAALATAFVTDWLVTHDHAPGSGWPLHVRTEKGDSFGRWLAHVECVQGHSLEQDLLAAGLADQVQ